jgi:hypothetical protein
MGDITNLKYVADLSLDLTKVESKHCIEKLLSFFSHSVYLHGTRVDKNNKFPQDSLFK